MQGEISQVFRELWTTYSPGFLFRTIRLPIDIQIFWHSNAVEGHAGARRAAQPAAVARRIGVENAIDGVAPNVIGAAIQNTARRRCRREARRRDALAA